MKPKTLYMESTEISAEKTASEITGLLILCGARQIAMDYGEAGKITGMHFTLVVDGASHAFKMPVRTEPVFQILNGRRRLSYDRVNSADKDRAQAERVAWRQLLMWTKAQLCMLEAGMAHAREIFLPYLLDRGGQTVFELFEASRFKALPAAKEA